MKLFSELIKDIDTIRALIRAFYIFGYKSRADYNKKSKKTYDNDRRRIESYFGDLLTGVTDKKGKRVGIRVNGDKVESNPFYRLFKYRSFTDNDLLLHFFIIDVLQDSPALTLSEMMTKICHAYYSADDEGIDKGILRLKLKEYVSLGILKTWNKGNRSYFALSDFLKEEDLDWDMVKYFREVNVLGVIGSFITDREEERKPSCLIFKHRQLFGALDSLHLLSMLEGIEKRELLAITKEQGGAAKIVVPLKILVNRQNGRQYLAAYDPKGDMFLNYRVDHVVDVVSSECEVGKEEFDNLLEKLEERFQYTWNVNYYYGDSPSLTELTLFVNEDEKHVLTRLQREGHGGHIERVSDREYKFSIRLYDPSEILPWVKSFIGRIVSFSCEDKEIERMFYSDMALLAEDYADE